MGPSSGLFLASQRTWGYSGLLGSAQGARHRALRPVDNINSEKIQLPHFAAGELLVQRGKVTCPRSHSNFVSLKTSLTSPVQCCLQETGVWVCEAGLPPGDTILGQAGQELGAGTASLEVVLALAVPPQVHFTLEAFGAQLTAEGLEARVLPAVSDEVGALAESLPTHLALVWLLTCGAARTGSGPFGPDLLPQCPAVVPWNFIMFYRTFTLENN